MLLVLALARPFEEAVALVSSVALPVILANAAGVFIFALFIHNLENERRVQAERDGLLREVERKNTELAIAAEIQRSFLPDTLPQIAHFDIAARCVMAKEVGGDFFDVIPFEVITYRTGSARHLHRRCLGKGDTGRPLHGALADRRPGQRDLASAGAG